MVAIKNMDCMPTNCLMCSEKCDGVRVCGYDGHEIEETPAVVTNQRDKDCPLVEIITCKDCNQVNCSHHAETCDPEEYRPDFYCGDAKRRE